MPRGGRPRHVITQIHVVGVDRQVTSGRNGTLADGDVLGQIGPRRPHQDGACRHTISELEILDAGHRVGAVGRTGSLINHGKALRDRAVGYRVVRPVARIHRRIGARAADDGVVAAAAGDRIVAGAAVQCVGDGIADDRVVAGAADGVVDVGARVVVVEIGIVDVARRVMAVSEIGELNRREQRRRTGIEIDAQVRRVVRQVVGIDAATVPDRLVDAIGRATGTAIVGRLARRR